MLINEKKCEMSAISVAGLSYFMVECLPAICTQLLLLILLRENFRFSQANYIYIDRYEFMNALRRGTEIQT